jgi:hypothetical protein
LELYLTNSALKKHEFNFEINQYLIVQGFFASIWHTVSKRMWIAMHYHHPFVKLNAIYNDQLSAGVDIETGGHIFQS